MKNENQYIANLKTRIESMFDEAYNLREEALALEIEAERLQNELDTLKSDIKLQDTKSKFKIANEILKKSNHKLGGFALQTIYDALDGKELFPEQEERFKLLAREYLSVVL